MLNQRLKNANFFLFIWLNIFISTSALATTYYVDATNGLDNNAGTSETAAWKTIAKVNASQFSPGDQILFKRGEIWRETLIVPSSGSIANPIRFADYGDGNQPILSGADIVSNWQKDSSITDYWSAFLGTRPSQLFFNSVRGTMKNDPSTLSSEYDWYYDPTNMRIWVFSLTNPNSSYDNPGIEASVRTKTIAIFHKGNINIENITCQYTQEESGWSGSIFVDSNYDNILLNNLTVRDNDSLAGITMEGTGTNKQVTNCEIYNTRHTTADRGAGIYLDGTGGSHTVSDNTVYDNTADGIKLGHVTGTPNNTISGNTVYGNGSTGIGINRSASFGNIIEHNTVYENGNLVADCYNIDLFIPGNNNIIRYNLTHNQHYVNLDAGGIRFDGDTGGHAATGNVAYYNIIYDERVGINVLNWDGTAMYNNTIYNSSLYGIHVHGELTDATVVKNNIINTASTHLIYNQDATNSAIDYNCYYPDDSSAFNWNETSSNFASWKNDSGQDANSLDQDPLFRSPDFNIFKLQATSPCIASGSSLGLPYDFAGSVIQTNTKIDIGAFQFIPDLLPPKNFYIKRVQ